MIANYILFANIQEKWQSGSGLLGWVGSLIPGLSSSSAPKGTAQRGSLYMPIPASYPGGEDGEMEFVIAIPKKGGREIK